MNNGADALSEVGFSIHLTVLKLWMKDTDTDN